MISIYWGKPRDGMRLQGLKAYPKSVTAPGAKAVTHQVEKSVTKTRAPAQFTP
ncbi:TPA: hypothetical protein QDZ42_004021 [Stenotrophomonas maltophilia]|nr:hypothetical protein [Stenotrophomonas maltophilia]